MKKYMIITILSLIIFNCHLSIVNCQSWKEMMDSTKYYQDKQNIQTALQWALQAEVKAKEGFGELDTNYTNTIKLVYYYYNYLGNFKHALEYCRKTKLLTKEIRGKKSIEYAEETNNLAFILKQLGILEEVEQLYKEALEIYQSIFEGDHQFVALSLSNLGNLYHKQNKYSNAEVYYKKSLEMYQRVFKSDHQYVATSLCKLASLYRDQSNFSDAEILFKKSLEMYQRIIKGDHPYLCTSLHEIAKLYHLEGKFKEAETYYIESLAMVKRIYKGGHPYIATMQSSLALFYNDQGRFSDAVNLCKEALEMAKRIYKGDHEDVANKLNSLASIYHNQGKYTDSEVLYTEALEMYKRLFKGDHPGIASSINSLAKLYHEMGRITLSEKLYKESMEMTKRLFKGDHPNTATVVNGIALLYKDQGRLAEAETLFKDASEMLLRLYQKNNPLVALSLNNLATLYSAQGRYDEAEYLLKDVLEINKKLYQKDHPLVAVSLNNLALINKIKSNIVDAEILYKQALDIYKKAYNNVHPWLNTCIYNIAILYDIQSKMLEAELYYKELLERLNDLFNHQSVYLSEREKKQFWNTMSKSFDGFNSFAVRRVGENPLILCNMYDNQLYTKGMLISSTNRIKNRIINSGDSALVAQFRMWSDMREFLVRLYKMSNEELKKKNFNIDSIENCANNFEKEISLKSEKFAKSYEKKKVTWKIIQGLLKPDETAVEVLRFQFWDKNRMTDTIYYAFLIISDKTEEHPDIVILENGKELENYYYNEYRNSIQFKKKDTVSFDRFWGKLYDKLKVYKKIYFSADGIYNKLNPSTLMMPDGKYLLDIQDIQQVNSTKDLLLGYYRTKEESNIYNSAVLIGNPNFSLSEELVKESIRKIRGEKEDEKSYELLADTRGTQLTKLPGTEKEVKNIEKFLKSKKWDVNSYLGDMAIKTAVTSANSPRVLHIATHGLFLEDVKRSGKELFGFEEQKMVENPLLRSGLFFTGADNFLKTGKESYAGEENGLLTAFEAMNLNLDRTELVVLSACETGLGEIRNGEGVFGLRRAFQQAGAKTVLMSLWKVNDQATQELMSSFYKNWVTGMTKRNAFSKAQQEIRAKYKEPYYWGAFVMVGE
jgi:CHAT domain-containing protein/lipopolysaccharide biosynthesis regulator YciM